MVCIIKVKLTLDGHICWLIARISFFFFSLSNSVDDGAVYSWGSLGEGQIEGWWEISSFALAMVSSSGLLDV